MRAIKSNNFVLAAALLTFSVSDIAAASLGTAFTFQGHLTQGTNAANGNYDLTFSLYDSDSSTNSITSPLTNSSVAVSNGLFMTTLDFGASILTCTDAWLEISARTNGNGAFTTLSPRQNLTPAPYSVRAAYADNLNGVLPTCGLAGSYTNALAFNNAANSFTGNGASLTNVNADTLGTLPASAFWQLGGNGGTTAGVNFLGTTDDQPLEFKVNNMRALRLEPNTNGAPNVIGGSPMNYALAGVVGATISGGYSNSVAGTNSTIGGGYANTVNCDNAIISGGAQNEIIAYDYYGLSYGGGSTISGGVQNGITLNEDPTELNTIGGGGTNEIGAGEGNTIGGGIGNYVRGYGGHPTIGCTIAGGWDNYVGYEIDGASIGGGVSNWVDGQGSTIAGGVGNSIVWVGLPSGNSIGGGEGNYIAAMNDCNISGGAANRIMTSSLDGCSAVGGGLSNLVTGDYCVIPGGVNNAAEADDATISGGANNTITGWGMSTVGGGQGNYVEGAYCNISGGQSNSVSGDFGTIPGGQNNFATNYAFAAGYRAEAVHQGAFVWAAGNTNDYPSTAANRVQFYAAGGLKIDYGGQDVDGSGLKWLMLASQTPGKVINVYNGAYLSEGGSWVDVCDRNAKKDFEPVNGREVLERVAKLPLTTWSYRSEKEPARHLGPVAQDFRAAFGLGVDDTHIATLDSSGVALAAIQGLNQKVEDQLKAKDAEIEELEQAVSELRKLVSTLAQRSNGSGE